MLHGSVFYVSVAVAIFAVVSFTFLFPCNWLIPLDRRTIAVVGSVLCYLSRRYGFPSTTVNLLDAIDFDVMVLLASIMIVNYIVIHLKETKKVIVYLQQLVENDPEHGFWMISLAAFAMSPFLTNDGVCLLFVEPILFAFEATIAKEESGDTSSGKLHSSDAMYFLLALACSTNIGSALTYTGNPQNMIVGTDATGVMPPYKFFLYMILPSLFSWVVTMMYIQRCWRQSKAQYTLVNTAEPSTAVVAAASSTDSSGPVKVPFPSLNIPWLGCYGDASISGCCSPRPSAATAAAIAPRGVSSPVSPRRKRARARDSLIKKVVRVVASPFPYMVLLLLAAMVVMIFVDLMPISGLICVSAVLMVLSVVVGNHWRNQLVWAELPEEVPQGKQDAADAPTATAVVGTRRRKHSRTLSLGSVTAHSRSVSAAASDLENADKSHLIGDNNNNNNIESAVANALYPQTSGVPTTDVTKSPSKEAVSPEQRLDNLNEFFEGLFASIDYSLLVIFMGTFIVVANMESTGIPKLTWDLIVGKKPFQSFSSIVGISLFVIFSSQLLGNVAVIQLAKPNVQDLSDDHKRIAWAVLSFVATVGGNLTITGSAANIIVVEKAARLDPNMSIDFFQHFRVCFWVTLLSCAVGGTILFFTVLCDNVNGSKW